MSAYNFYGLLLSHVQLMLFKLSLTSTKESPKEEIISPTRKVCDNNAGVSIMLTLHIKTSEISVTSDVANIFQYPATYEQNDFLKQVGVLIYHSLQCNIIYFM